MKQKNILIIGAIILLGVFGVIFISGVDKTSKPIEMSGYLFVLDTGEKVYLTHSFVEVKQEVRTVYTFSEKLDKVISEDQIKEIAKLDNVVPEAKPVISIEDARTSAERELKGEAFSDWFEILFGSVDGLYLEEGVLVYDIGDTTVTYYKFPVFRDDAAIALIAIDGNN